LLKPPDGVQKKPTRKALASSRGIFAEILFGKAGIIPPIAGIKKIDPRFLVSRIGKDHKPEKGCHPIRIPISLRLRE
jgi:hypothetical protein